MNPPVMCGILVPACLQNGAKKRVKSADEVSYAEAQIAGHTSRVVLPGTAVALRSVSLAIGQTSDSSKNTYHPLPSTVTDGEWTIPRHKKMVSDPKQYASGVATESAV